MYIHNASASTIRTHPQKPEVWVHYLAKYRSTEKSFFKVFLSTFFFAIFNARQVNKHVCLDKVVKTLEDPFPWIYEGLCPWLKPEHCEWYI